MSHEESDLRAWFETLREGDRRLVPPLKAAASRRSPWRFALAAAVLVLVAVLSAPRRDSAPIEQLSEWRSPTESLLDVPESPLVTTVPSLR